MNRKLVLMLTLPLLVGMLSVASGVQRVEASGTIYIRANGGVDPPDAPISTSDNVTYTLTGNITSDADSIVVERDDIVIEGAGYILSGWGSGNGITLTDRSNVTIQNTNITYFDYGIWLGSSSSNTINGNTITNDGYGIYLNSSSNNSMSGNTIANNHDRGIGLDDYSNHNSIGGNNITNNWCGIWLYSSSDYNNIYKNSIVNNDYGIGFDTSSNYNSVYENNVTASTSTGIRVNFVSNNKFYHNNFIGNTYPAVAMIPGCDNSWDDGYHSGGNYWSDYNGTDANHDGIGDTQYVIDENNTDRYPLMNIIPEFPSFLILPLFCIATLLAVMVYRRKHPQNE